MLSANSMWNVVNFRRGLIQALLREGYRVAVVAPADGHEAGLKDSGVDVHPLPIDRSGMNPVAEMALLRRYVRLIRTLQPAAFLGFTIKPNIYGSLAARLTGVPAINNISGLGTMFLGKSWQSRLANGLYRLALRRSAAVFFQNPEDRDLFVQAGTVRKDQARLVPGSGIDLFHYSAVAAADGPATFLFVGRLLADKGIREFVAAARIVRRRFPTVRLQILGGVDAGNRTAIPAIEIDQWRREGHVELLGDVADVRPHIARATAVVLPSYREGLPRVLLEAAAMARPMIATDVPGCRSVVSDGENGLLCPPRNPDALAQAMIDLLEASPETLAAMGEAARRTVEEKFGQQHVIAAYLTALRDIGLAFRVGAQ